MPVDRWRARVQKGETGIWRVQSCAPKVRHWEWRADCETRSQARAIATSIRIQAGMMTLSAAPPPLAHSGAATLEG